MTVRADGRFRRGALAAALGAAALAPALIALPHQGAREDDPYRELARFGAALALIRDKYVDKPDEAKLIEAALQAMAGSLDPHSGYVGGRTYRSLQSLLKGEVGNVGLALVDRDRRPTVESVARESSAARAGVRPGDAIEAIDGEATADVARAVEKMRGETSTSVRLTIGRGAAVRDVEVRRDLVELKSLEFHVESGDIGYIRIPQFIDGTAGELRNALARLGAEAPAEALKGYVLDLRNNPGGLVDPAIETVNAFVDGGRILSTRGRAPGADRVFVARPGADLSQGEPLVVLVNGGTASAAEIVAGALQDLRRATLIGTRTFGKGSMQSSTPLGDGALQLTTALYFLPSGRSIQARGVDPDIEVLEEAPPRLEAPAGGTGEASLPGHLRNPRGDRPASPAFVPPDPRDDRQLIAAVDFLHGAERAARR